MPIDPHDEQSRAPTVSIGVPVYNGERYIREALDSALKQTFTDFELIISDNNSSDATREICLEYMARDSRIKYVLQDKNQGGRWNMSFVARNAVGRFFTWLAHDDILEPQFLEQTVKYMTNNPQVVLATGDFSLIDEHGVELNIEKLDRLRDCLPWETRRVPFFEYGNSNVYLCIYGTMRTELCKLIMAKLKKPYMADGSEYPILSRFAVSGEIASLPIVLRRYRIHNSSLYKTELYKNTNRPKFIRAWHTFVNLLLLRIDFSRVLLGSNIPIKAKYMITRRHIIMGWKWCWFQFGKILPK
jgi:glycosyltransferase involved in cell wall biosynthesis